jgi:hypothetical protein
MACKMVQYLHFRSLKFQLKNGIDDMVHGKTGHNGPIETQEKQKPGRV